MSSSTAGHSVAGIKALVTGWPGEATDSVVIKCGREYPAGRQGIKVPVGQAAEAAQAVAVLIEWAYTRGQDDMAQTVANYATSKRSW